MSILDSVTVGPLAAGATYVYVFPGADKVTPPDLILPLAPTAIGVIGTASSAEVTFKNRGSVQAAAVTFMLLWFHGEITRRQGFHALGWQGVAETAPAAAAVSEPSGFEDRFDFRQFVSFVDVLLTALALPANAVELSATYAATTLHAMVLDTTASNLALYDGCVTKAAALSLPIYPGIRLMASGSDSGTAAAWCDLARWQSTAAKVSTMLARRPTGEVRIALDSEGYGGGVEPNVDTLTSAGYTEEQFNTAIAPLTDVLVAAVPTPVVCIYPIAAFASNNVHLFLKRLVALLGPTHVQAFHEAPGAWTDTVEVYRKTRYTDWTTFVSAFAANTTELEKTLGQQGMKHRVGCGDDVYRDTGQTFLTDRAYLALRRCRPWIFDNTRADRASWGTASARHWLTLSSANRTHYVWEGPPLLPTAEASCGENATALLQTYRSTVDTGNEVIGPTTVDDLAGTRLSIPNGYVYGVWRQSSIMPTTTPQAWTYIQTFQFPALSAPTPMFGQCVSNLSLWQVYVDTDLIWERAGETHVLMAAPSPNTDITIALTRNGNTDWRWSINGGAVQHFTAGATVGATNLLVIGGGKVPGTLGLGNGHLMSCDRFLKKRTRIAHVTYSDADLVAASAGVYPIGRTT
jgi:hypothetical protein